MIVRFFGLLLALIAGAFHLAVSKAADEPATDNVVKFARFRVNDNTTFGVVEGDNVREVSGTIFGDWQKTLLEIEVWHDPAVEMQGRLVGGIRIRAPQAPAAPAAPAGPSPTQAAVDYSQPHVRQGGPTHTHTDSIPGWDDEPAGNEPGTTPEPW